MGDGAHPPRRVLLTGGSGFVGSRLYDRLERAGYQVACLTRRPEEARQQFPNRLWVKGDVRDADSLARALAGSEVAWYLVHQMGGPADGLVEREAAAARTFAEAAAKAGVGRIVYLGGMAPLGPASEHLHSRLVTGEMLRAGPVPCLELRAAMIIGAGSASWQMVRDLAARLPAMVLPKWLRNRSEPVAVDDVLGALEAAAHLPLPASRSEDLPGPELLTHEELLMRVAALLGHRPLIVRVPFVTPLLSSYWIELVTSVDPSVARALVEGLTSDLVARRRDFWERAGLPAPIPFDEAARRALAAERVTEAMRWRLLEGATTLLSRRPQRA